MSSADAEGLGGLGLVPVEPGQGIPEDRAMEPVGLRLAGPVEARRYGIPVARHLEAGSAKAEPMGRRKAADLLVESFEALMGRIDALKVLGNDGAIEFAARRLRPEYVDS